MKKTVFLGVVGIMAVTSANAGWFSDLFSKTEPAPATLSEACNIDEVTAVCPEIILGQQTLVECLTENVKTVSQKCVDYVKKAVSENSSEITALTDKIKSTASDKVEVVTTDAATTTETVKSDLAEKVNAVKLEVAQKLIDSASK